VYWPTVQEPDPADRPRVEQLRTDLVPASAAARDLTAAMLLMIRENPVLTNFVTGLVVEAEQVSVPNPEAVGSKLADLPTLEKVQRLVLETLNDLLTATGKARQKLCLDPERILDVPQVYEQVMADLAGINPRFDKAARERVAHHQRQQAWIDIGMTAAMLVLFVGGLLVSLLGGPAGVAAYLETSQIVLGVVMAARSGERADVLTALSEASVQRGQGMVALEAASEARFWAGVDVAFVAIDVAGAGFKVAKQAVSARVAEAARAAEKAAEGFEEVGRATERIPFEQLFAKGNVRTLEIGEEAVARLGNVSPGSKDYRNLVGAIAEETVEATVASSGDYVVLGSKFQGNKGIDLVLVRRSHFEQVFGKLADARDARKVLSTATEDELKRLGETIKRAGNAEDLVSVEVKFSRQGVPVHELLKPGYGGVQFNRRWYQGVLGMMRRAKTAETVATGKLLEAVIGAEAEGLERLSRFGIVMDPGGGFRLQRLSDEIINLANQSRQLYQHPRYVYAFETWRRAKAAGDATKAEQIMGMLEEMNKQIAELDRAVKLAVESTEAAARQAHAGLQRGGEALRTLGELGDAVPTPGVEQALFGATAVARAHLAAAKQALDRAGAEERRAQELIATARARFERPTPEERDVMGTIR
jgi:hypothetical protein